MTKGLWVFSLVLTGFDFRFGWTRAHVGPIPWWLSVMALAIIIGADIWFISVLKANSFAASIIQVEEGVKLCCRVRAVSIGSTSDVFRVRHCEMARRAPGSWLTRSQCSYFSLIVPPMTLRLLNEEKFLGRELPGYSDYCREVPWRLLPFVW